MRWFLVDEESEWFPVGSALGRALGLMWIRPSHAWDKAMKGFVLLGRVAVVFPHTEA